MPLLFENPEKGNFRLKNGAAAYSAGFKNIEMDSFGVVSPRLKALAKKVELPQVKVPGPEVDGETINFMGANLKKLTTLGERSATGMDDIRGVLVISVRPGAAQTFFRANDVIISLNGQAINSLKDLQKARMSVIGTSAEIVIFRNQHAYTKRIEFDGQK